MGIEEEEGGKAGRDLCNLGQWDSRSDDSPSLSLSSFSESMFSQDHQTSQLVPPHRLLPSISSPLFSHKTCLPIKFSISLSLSLPGEALCRSCVRHPVSRNRSSTSVFFRLYVKSRAFTVSASQRGERADKRRRRAHCLI